MCSMPAGEFNAKCQAVIDEVKTKRQRVVIRKGGQPVAKLGPVDVDQDESSASSGQEID